MQPVQPNPLSDPGEVARRTGTVAADFTARLALSWLISPPLASATVTFGTEVWRGSGLRSAAYNAVVDAGVSAAGGLMAGPLRALAGVLPARYGVQSVAAGVMGGAVGNALRQTLARDGALDGRQIASSAVLGGVGAGAMQAYAASFSAPCDADVVSTMLADGDYAGARACVERLEQTLSPAERTHLRAALWRQACDWRSAQGTRAHSGDPMDCAVRMAAGDLSLPADLPELSTLHRALLSDAEHGRGEGWPDLRSENISLTLMDFEREPCINGVNMFDEPATWSEMYYRDEAAVGLTPWALRFYQDRGIAEILPVGHCLLENGTRLDGVPGETVYAVVRTQGFEAVPELAQRLMLRWARIDAEQDLTALTWIQGDLGWAHLVTRGNGRLARLVPNILVARWTGLVPQFPSGSERVSRDVYQHAGNATRMLEGMRLAYEQVEEAIWASGRHVSDAAVLGCMAAVSARRSGRQRPRERAMVLLSVWGTGQESVRRRSETAGGQRSLHRVPRSSPNVDVFFPAAMPCIGYDSRV